jgi:hypothetical protein
MAYLAACLGRHPDIRMDPITDQRDYFEPFAASGNDLGGWAGELDRMRAILLADVLPAPRHPIAPAELAAFKETYWDELHAFRLDAEHRLLQCARERDAELRDRMLEQAAGDLQLRVVELQARMAQRRWPTVTGTLAAAIGAMPAAVSLVATGDPLEGAVPKSGGMMGRA